MRRAYLSLCHESVPPGARINYSYAEALVFVCLKGCFPQVKVKSRNWLSSRNFFQGGQNLLLCKFLLLFYCFRTKFQGGAKVFRGGQTASGGRPHAPPVEESQAEDKRKWNLPPSGKRPSFIRRRKSLHQNQSSHRVSQKNC